jgi:hypothetical protein
MFNSKETGSKEAMITIDFKQVRGYALELAI